MFKTLRDNFGTILATVLSILSIAFTIYFGNSDFRQFTARFAIPVIVAVSAFVLAIAILYYNSVSKNIIFCRDRNDAPRRFKAQNLMRYVIRHKYNLTVIGRTNISWFSPDNDVLLKLYKTAAHKGCRIVFVIQAKNVDNMYVNDDTNQVINDHYDKVINTYLKLAEDIEIRRSLLLRITSEEIENSMTMVTSSDERYVAYFTYDIGQNINKKPFIIFKKDTVFEELKNKFRLSIENAKDYEEYKKRHDDATKELGTLIGRYGLHSAQRENNNEKLIPYFAKSRKPLTVRPKEAPVSIQFLITNHCTSTCIMCKHHKIMSKNELSDNEIGNVFKSIADIGTKNVIVSGGEPLFRDGCIDMLTMANRDLKLNLGLLTNGIKKGGESISLSDAEKLRESCKWIQLSIDSFDPVTYTKIRGADYSIVKESLKNLEAVNVNLEVCFTIQRLNIDEAIRIVSGHIRKDFSSMIRFKFAHGPDSRNEFLIGHHKEKIREFLNSCNNNRQFNTQYMLNMFGDGYFNVDDISEGTPMKEKNQHFRKNKYRCQVLDLTCKIDAVGDIFPCCYLFDDNQGASALRENYKLGTLRDEGTGSVNDPALRPNLLKKIWFESAHMDLVKNQVLPINDRACDNCTRHFYQNEFLNELDILLNRYNDIGFEKTLNQRPQEVLWI